MELVNGGGIEMLSRRSVHIKSYDDDDDDEDEESSFREKDDDDATSLKIDLSMAEQFYYEVISSFQKEEHYRWVDNALKWKTKDPEIKVDIYCPHGKMESGVFFGVSNCAMPFVLIFAFNESTSLLRQVLLETRVVDWIGLIAMGPGFEVFFEELFEIKNIKVQKKYVANYRFKSKEECLRDEIHIPEGHELRCLDDSHASLIHSLWPHNIVEGSYAFVKVVLRLNGGIGLFSTSDGSLVSWIAQTDFGGLGLLQTVEEHKRKGYARLMVRAISKRMAEELDLDSILFVVEGNESSRKLFDSLGYESRATIAWYIL